MQLGIFAKTFVRPTLKETLIAVRAHGLDCVQFNMACAGLPSLPDRIDPDLCERIRTELSGCEITMAAVSGTFNMAHPQEHERRAGLGRLRILAGACHQLGTSVITLCTGTRAIDNMWKQHPDNDTAPAWRDLLASIREVVRIAEDTGVTMAFEPEVANVVDSSRKGRRLLDEVGSPRLKVVMDPANLFHAGQLGQMHEILEEAFTLLGKDVVIAHAKDLSHDGDAGHQAAGQGKLDYDLYIQLLRSVTFSGPLILHGLTEAQVPQSLAFLRDKLAAKRGPR